MKLFLCDFSACGEETLTRLTASLPPERREKAERLRDESARRASVIAFCLARYALSLWNPAYADLPFLLSDTGKPKIADGECRFNLTHTGAGAAVALSRGSEVGVDLEAVRPLRAGLAERFCSPAELAGAAEEADKVSAVIRLWTQKEAEAKRTGVGIGQDLRKLDLRNVASRKITLGGFPHWLSVSPTDEFPEPVTVSPEELRESIEQTEK